ncbi:MAG: thioredoxin family protein [Lautropia sp.]|nr:thioredoxin family protein [Lautropia sp.]
MNIDRCPRIIHRPSASQPAWTVACLCAQWCGTCRGYRDMLMAEAATYPDTAFLWVDIEDDSELVGDLDVETFPTLLVMSGASVLFFGPMLPGVDQLRRLLRALLDHRRQPVPVDEDVVLLAERLNALIGVSS